MLSTLHSFIQQLLIEHLEGAQLCSRHREAASLPSGFLPSSGGRRDRQQQFNSQRSFQTLTSTMNKIRCSYGLERASQVAQWKRICLPMQETQQMRVQSLGWEDTLGKEMAVHSSILAGEISWTEEPGGLQSMGLQSDTTEHACTRGLEQISGTRVGHGASRVVKEGLSEEVIFDLQPGGGGA